MAQWVKAPATKLDDQSSIARAYIVEGRELASTSCPRTSACVPWQVCMLCIQINKQTSEIRQ